MKSEPGEVRKLAIGGFGPFGVSGPFFSDKTITETSAIAAAAPRARFTMRWRVEIRATFAFAMVARDSCRISKLECRRTSFR